MKTSPANPLFQKLIDRLSESRDLTVSILIHLVLVLLIAWFVAIPVLKEAPEKPPEAVIMVNTPAPAAPVEPVVADLPALPMSAEAPVSMPDFIKGSAPMNLDAYVAASPASVQAKDPGPTAPPTGNVGTGVAKPSWNKDSGSSSQPLGVRHFEFVAYQGKYDGGNWNSTARVVNGKIESGSLPNLLTMISVWSKNKIKTNHEDVRAIKLDSDEILIEMPPFIFLTGSRDFKLTDKEVEHLRRYLQGGGALWGDSSVPGKNSSFDLAFRREMKRVVGRDAEFRTLPANHTLFTQGYFPKIKTQPPGLNYYQQPVEALMIQGEIAVLYTSNDYGDMWQVGLNDQGGIDLRKDRQGNYLTVNPSIYSHSETYLRNLSPEALTASYQFGMNVVVHLLTRWEKHTQAQQRL